MPLTFIFPSI